MAAESLGAHPRTGSQYRYGASRLESRQRLLDLLDMQTGTAMKKPPKPKTLIEVFTQEGLLDDPDVVLVCECHKLTHCPTAWMTKGTK
jgi:hypothetical protein